MWNHARRSYLASRARELVPFAPGFFGGSGGPPATHLFFFDSTGNRYLDTAGNATFRATTNVTFSTTNAISDTSMNTNGTSNTNWSFFTPQDMSLWKSKYTWEMFFRGFTGLADTTTMLYCGIDISNASSAVVMMFQPSNGSLAWWVPGNTVIGGSVALKLPTTTGPHHCCISVDTTQSKLWLGLNGALEVKTHTLPSFSPASNGNIYMIGVGDTINAARRTAPIIDSVRITHGTARYQGSSYVVPNYAYA